MNDAIRQLRLENDRLRTQIARLESSSRQTWIGPGLQSISGRIYLLRVVGGNTVYSFGGSTWTGIKRASFSSVPTLVPTLTTTPDGAGYGYLRVAGSDSGSLVWITNGAFTDSGGNSIVSSFSGAILSSQLVTANQIAYVACDAGGYAPIYVISRGG